MRHLMLVAAFLSGLARAPESANVEQVLVEGDVPHPAHLSVLDPARLPRHTVQTKDHNGDPVSFEGVALVDILRESGLTFAETLRGNRLATYLLVEAADGYKVVFALPELDPDFTDRMILLADHRNGQALPPSEGPFRLVIPDEKRQARWVRQVQRLVVLRSAPPTAGTH